MGVRSFPAPDLREAIWGDREGFETVLNELTDSSRWSLHYRWVFKHEGKFYETSYSKGATESQDEQPFEYDTDVECREVVPTEKTIIDYIPAS